MLQKLIIFAFLFVLITAYCPENSTQFPQNQENAKCYMFFNDRVTSEDAQSACMALNGTLPSIHDGFTNTFLASQGHSAFSRLSFWVGAQGLGYKTGLWLWLDDTLTDFSNWYSGSPSGTCGAMDVNNGYWSLENCNLTKAYVCQVDPIIPPTTPPPPKCPQEWVFFPDTNSCYFLLDNNERWLKSEYHCTSMGGHLASIHSLKELNYITTTLTYFYGVSWVDRLWIGLYLNDRTNTWTWTDGTPFDFNAWGHDGSVAYPIIGGPGCAFITKNSTFANSLDCSSPIYFVCKMSA